MFKKKQKWFVVGGYVFIRDMLKQVIMIDTVKEDKELKEWSFWVHFKDLPSQNLCFADLGSTIDAYNLFFAHVREVQK